MTPRIAILARYVRSHDGVGSINLEVAREASRRGCAVTVVAMSVQSDLLADPNVTFVRVPIERVPTDLLRILCFSLFTSLWLWRRRNAFDVVVSSGFSTFSNVDLNIVQFVFAEWMHAPDMQERRFTSPRSVYHYLFSRALVPFENAAFRRSRRLIACSAGVRDELERHARIDSSRILVVPNGIRTSAFERSRPERERFGLPPHVPIVLFAGDITAKRKNLDVILDALDRVPELHLAVASQYYPGNAYVELVRRRGLDGRVHFLGKCDDMPAVMSSVDFFALFSHYEPFGLVVIEALSCGLPTITASNVGAACAVTPESGIVLAAPVSADSVAEAFRRLLADRNGASYSSARARAAAAAFTVERMTDAYLSEFVTLAHA